MVRRSYSAALSLSLLQACAGSQVPAPTAAVDVAAADAPPTLLDERGGLELRYRLVDDEPGGLAVAERVVTQRLSSLGVENTFVRVEDEELVVVIAGPPNQVFVQVVFDADGAKRLAAITTLHVDRRLAIMIDGVVQTAPVVRSPITSGSAHFHPGAGRAEDQLREAERIALLFRSGALPSPLELVHERTIPPLPAR
jgi:hypothetical protein